MQETWIQSLIQEDPTSHRTTKPISHNYWACVLQSRNRNYWHLHTLLWNEKPPQWETSAQHPQSSLQLPQQEKSHCSNKDPAQSKTNKYKQ